MALLDDYFAQQKAKQDALRQRLATGQPLAIPAPPDPAEAPSKAKTAKEPTPTAGEAHGLSPQALVYRAEHKHQILNEAGIKRAINQLDRLPAPGESIHAIMTGDFHGFDLIPTVQRMAGQPIDELHLSTLGFNKRNNAQLCGMFDEGKISKVAVICGQMFVGLDPDIYAQAKAAMDARGLRLVVARNHTKIVLFAIGENRYVIETSANLRSCNSFEQFALINDAGLYDHHRRWLEHLLANPGA